MPSKTDKQKRFFAWLSHDEESAKKLGVDPEVAKEFHEEDKKKDKEIEDKKEE
jgi:hypothetical protein